MRQVKPKFETTPDLEQTARAALFGLMSNPAILNTDAQLTNLGLESLADAAFRAAYYLELRLHQERTK